MEYSKDGRYRRALITTQDSFNHTAQYTEQEKLIFKITVRGGISSWYETYKTYINGQMACYISKLGDIYRINDEHGGTLAEFNDSDKNYSVTPEYSWQFISSKHVVGDYDSPKGFLHPCEHLDPHEVSEDAKKSAKDAESESR